VLLLRGPHRARRLRRRTVSPAHAFTLAGWTSACARRTLIAEHIDTVHRLLRGCDQVASRLGRTQARCVELKVFCCRSGSIVRLVRRRKRRGAWPTRALLRGYLSAHLSVPAAAWSAAPMERLGRRCCCRCRRRRSRDLHTPLRRPPDALALEREAVRKGRARPDRRQRRFWRHPQSAARRHADAGAAGGV
jgi:hypothetical protein